jgi:hypothetical protein
VAGVGWLAALIVTVARSDTPFLPDVFWLRLAVSALLLALAPLIALGLVAIKGRLRRSAVVWVAVLSLLGLAPAALAMTQLPQAGATVNMDALGSITLYFSISSPLFSLGVTLGALTRSARDTPAPPTTGWSAPAALAAYGFGAVTLALGILGVISIQSTPLPDCTRLGCVAIGKALQLQATITVMGGAILIFVLALIEGMLGYWLSANLTQWQGYRLQAGR